jgi:hypothetical protein
MTKYKSHQSVIARNNKSDITDISGSTLLILLAQNLPATYYFKSCLIAAAPIATMFLTLLWEFIVREFSFFRKERKAQKKSMQAMQKMNLLLKDPNISNQVKESLMQQWGKVQLALMQQQIQELNVPMELP